MRARSPSSFVSIVVDDVGEALADRARLRVHLGARQVREQVARRAAQRRHRRAVDEAVIPVQVVRRVRDHEIGPDVADDLSIRRTSSCIGMSSTRHGFSSLRMNSLAPRTSAPALRLGACARRRGSGSRRPPSSPRRPRRDEPREQAAGADLEIVGVRAEREHAAALLLRGMRFMRASIARSGALRREQDVAAASGRS